MGQSGPAWYRKKESGNWLLSGADLAFRGSANTSACSGSKALLALSAVSAESHQPAQV